VPTVQSQASRIRGTRALLCCAYIAAGAAALWAADSVAQLLFNKVRAGVVENVNNFPRYTCVQTVTRSQFELPGLGNTCANLVAAHSRNSADRRLRWHDRLRLDVAVGEHSEMFSWAGASKFEGGDVSQLVGRGATGSGEFGSFLASIFGGDAEDFVYRGLRDTPLGRLASFDFNVPLAKSHYRYSSGTNAYSTVAYKGSFFGDPDTGDLRKLELEAVDFPSHDVCHIADAIEYTRTTIGPNSFVLPKSSTMDVIYQNATESLNETMYSGCREYVGESTIRFDVDENGNTAESAAKREGLKPLPPKTRLRVRISPPVDSSTAAAGDSITGVIDAQVKDKGEVLVRVGDKLHGRLLRLEQTMGANPRWIVAILFETLERSGIEQPVNLHAVDDGDRTPLPPSRIGRGYSSPVTGGSLTSERPAGGGIFSFIEFGNLVLGQKFESEWETR
jgi:hypothetical protein